MLSRRALISGALTQGTAAPDRSRVVRRHNPVLRSWDPLSPLSVGNGEFAFTADLTGLQTLPDIYESGIPLCTQSQWGWHSFPSPGGQSPDDLRLETYDTYGRPVGYATSADGQKELFNWLRENPHRLHLGRIGFDLLRDQIEPETQTLDLWTGIIESRFHASGAPVRVRTACHPNIDLLAVEVDSPAALTVIIEFPYGSPTISAADWKRPEAHKTTVLSASRLDLRRNLDQDRYFVGIAAQRAAMERSGPHRFLLRASGPFSFVCAFHPSAPVDHLPDAPQVMRAAKAHWSQFWSTGGFIDLDGSTDPRAKELERRIILSQYLTAIQCCGSMPPQETGLTCNSWFGKSHLEMHWWHAVHFALWNRTPLLERSLPWYEKILPSAREKARRQGYRGVRWPKMVGPEGRDSPSNIGPLLIWQQPHPVAYAEFCYRAHPDRATLDRYRTIVFETAGFMASFAAFDRQRNRYVLGPPVIPAQENHPPRETWNPTYELEYWDWALDVAQQWRKRLGLEPEPHWEDVRSKLSALPVKDGVYLAHENCPQTFTECNRDHPSMLAALGVLPGRKVDPEIMRRTLHKVMAEWKWPDTWGWDYPMVAMTATRLGEPELAIDALLMDIPKNRYLPNGHNYQRPGLPLYVPGNGGLLAAVALMANHFPKKGWQVRHKQLNAWL